MGRFCLYQRRGLEALPSSTDGGMMNDVRRIRPVKTSSVANAERSGYSGAPPNVDGLDRDARELIARVQRLAEMPRPEVGYPLEWLVEAFHVGDLSAIATLTLRRGQ